MLKTVASSSRSKNIPTERVQYAAVDSTVQKAANLSVRYVNLIGGILSEGDFVATTLLCPFCIIFYVKSSRISNIYL